MTVAAPRLEMTGITKRFPGVLALDDVSFECRAGEIHALVGENGAGKSTLVKILSGAYRPDRGSIVLDGREVRFSHPRDAQLQGISIIYQELNLLPDRTVAQNIFTGREPSRFGLVDRRRLEEDTSAMLQRVGVHRWISPRSVIRDLSVAQQQMVEIAKAIAFQSKVLVMDEPTAALAPAEVDVLFELARRLQADGLAIVYISHRLKEVFDLAQRVTVLKDGRKVATLPVRGTTMPELVQLMVGRTLGEYYPPFAVPSQLGDPVLRVVHGFSRGLHDISLEVRRGEIVGLAGLQGAGQTELLRAIFGIAPFRSGEVSMEGERVHVRSPRDAVSLKIGFLSEDRKAEGLALMQPIVDNMLLAWRSQRPLLESARPGAAAPSPERLGRSVDLRSAGLREEAQYLSGGNQQKVVLSKWLATNARLLLFAEPTRGIDVNARSGIRRLMRAMARDGAGILMTSSDLAELVGLSDRIVVMRAGRIIGQLPAGASQEDVMLLAAGAQAHESETRALGIGDHERV